jgi:hypothetical protein
MSSPRPPAKRQNKSEIKVEESALFSGPLPPPAVLKGYGEVDSQYPERIFKMAESYAAADVKGRNAESLAVILGMAFSFDSSISTVNFFVAIFLTSSNKKSVLFTLRPARLGVDTTLFLPGAAGSSFSVSRLSFGRTPGGRGDCSSHK